MASSRPNISVLVGGTWLHGRVTPGEFSKAIGAESHRTFKLSKGTLRGERVVVAVRGSHVNAWEWLIPERAKPKRRAAKRRRAVPGSEQAHEPLPVVVASASQDFDAIRGANEHSGLAPLTIDQTTDLVMATTGLDDSAVTMLCIAAGVDSMDHLTQATLPAFREVLAVRRAEAGVPA